MISIIVAVFWLVSEIALLIPAQRHFLSTYQWTTEFISLFSAQFFLSLVLHYNGSSSHPVPHSMQNQVLLLLEYSLESVPV